jgi:hypothetical protein
MNSDKEYEDAAEGSRLNHLRNPWATAARYDASTGMITVDLNRGFSVSFHKSRHQALYKATDEQLSEIDVSHGGTSVFFPKLEDGFTVEGMLAGRFGRPWWERQWADEHGLKIAENALPEKAETVAA